jgi:hypothetical protein
MYIQMDFILRQMVARVDITSNTYYDWTIDRAYIM